MCKLASFLYRIDDGVLDVFVSVLDSHSETEKNIPVDKKNYREGHYLPDGTLELRKTEEDRWANDEAVALFKTRFPSFNSFFSWSVKNGITIGGGLDLSGLTSEEKQKAMSQRRK